MEKTAKKVDGFRFLPPGLAAWIQTYIPEEEFNGPIPWTPLAKPLSRTTLALVTSAGISLKKDQPFDMDREKREPTWGDPSFRAIPKETTEEEIDVNHLHINTDYMRQDINVMLPLNRMADFENEGIIGEVGDHEGQRAVLLAALAMLEKAEKPGEVWHLPFTWPEAPKETNWHPPEMSPLIKAYLPEIKQARSRKSRKNGM
jgi:D-proline reductase (dithiol) PrdB